MAKKRAWSRYSICLSVVLACAEFEAFSTVITPGAAPLLAPAGSEFYTVAGNGDSYVALALSGGTFDFDDSGSEDCTDGLGPSAPLNRRVILQGTDIANNAGIQGVSAIFEHASIVPPATAAFSLTALSAGVLHGASVLVSRDDGSGGVTNEEWALTVCRNTGASSGSETASRNACPGQGGPISMTLSFRPKLTFVKLANPACVVTIDTGVPVPMTSEPFKWNDAPAGTQSTAGGSFDKTCDGTLDPPAVPASTLGGWFPGTFIARCAGDVSCAVNPPFTFTRLFRFTGPGWGIALHATVTTAPLDSDADGVMDDADDCAFFPDPAQVDSDGDGRGDPCQCSACGGVADTDADNDHTPDCFDCDDADNSIWRQPGEATNLRISANKATITWSAPAFFGATTVQYDTIRSLIADNFALPAVCIEGDDGSNTTSTDFAAPLTSEVWFYLVVVENDCPGAAGRNTGKDSFGNPRVARDCP